MKMKKKRNDNEDDQDEDQGEGQEERAPLRGPEEDEGADLSGQALQEAEA